MEYQERYCAFADVLGFSELISAIQNSETLRDRDTRFKEVRALLQVVHDPGDLSIGTKKEAELLAQSISDAVALSVMPTDIGLMYLCYSLESLSLDLLKRGYFLRGAIVKGSLYQDEHMIFGEALMEAFHFESQVARFPRIVVSREVAADCKAYSVVRQGSNTDEFDAEIANFFKGVLRQADDGPMHLNVLRRIVDRLRLNPGNSGEFSSIRSQIIRRFDEATDNPKHFEKVQWFARYWNDVMPEGEYEISRFERIPGAGLDRKPAVWG